jgi:signal transduction histidine kinase
VRTGVDALEHLVSGLGTAILALAALIAGVLLAQPALVRSAADRERARLSRWGPEIIDPGPLPARRWVALRDAGVRRELAWVGIHGTAGFLLGLLGLTLPLYALQCITFPLWYHLVPGDIGGPGVLFWPIRGLPDALLVALAGVGWLVATIVAGPYLARLQAWPGRRLLAPPPGADLSARVAHLTATRAAALDAHAAELRRIERSLHDGTQNRLVAVTVLLGLARRALTRDPAAAEHAIDRAQTAAEDALSELRTVVRGILPPVLADRGLAGALDGLARDCGIPCELTVDAPGRFPTAVEATAYYVVAEALTNATKHSGAGRATVSVRREEDRLVLRIDDDGMGGADETRGSGLTGIRRRVEAYDGTMTLTSPAGGPTTMRVELPCGS